MMLIKTQIKGLALLQSILLLVAALEECLQEVQTRKYYKIKKCHRSDQVVISRNNIKDLKDCLKYARDKNGLAVNFSPPEANRTTKADDALYTCVVLGCAENTNQTTLISDQAYDYYSAYGNFTLLMNATCVKSLGMFRLFQGKENYTTAIDECQKIGADLAHILSETRTNMLSNVVASIADWFRVAYVGLDDSRQEGEYETPLGDAIECYKWRAWSPGHPKSVIKSDDCVVLDTERSWKVVNCRDKLPFLCEYYHTAPSPNRTLTQDCDEIDDEEEQRVCKEVQRKNNRRRKKRRNRCEED